MSAQQASSYVTGTFPAVPRAARAPGRPADDLVVLVHWLPAIALTLLDAALTYAWIQAGIAAEGNPWLADLVATSGPGAAMAVRAGIGVALVSVLALLARRHHAARRGLLFVSGVLGMVLCWHLAGGAMAAFA